MTRVTPGRWTLPLSCERWQSQRMPDTAIPSMASMPNPHLPSSVRSRQIDIATGLNMHVLESGEPGRPLVLLLHGFPELAYSWRRVIKPLADLGFHVVAPDQRGYGRTTGWDARFDGDLPSFSLSRIATDVLALVQALGVS